MGAGLWMPEAEPLRLLRRNIDRKPEKIREVLMEANLRKKILGGVSNDEKKTIKAFAAQNTENALKTKPKVSAIIFWIYLTLCSTWVDGSVVAVLL